MPKLETNTNYKLPFVANIANFGLLTFARKRPNTKSFSTTTLHRINFELQSLDPILCEPYLQVSIPVRQAAVIECDSHS